MNFEALMCSMATDDNHAYILSWCSLCYVLQAQNKPLFALGLCKPECSGWTSYQLSLYYVLQLVQLQKWLPEDLGSQGHLGLISEHNICFSNQGLASGLCPAPIT